MVPIEWWIPIQEGFQDNWKDEDIINNTVLDNEVNPLGTQFEPVQLTAKTTEQFTLLYTNVPWK